MTAAASTDPRLPIALDAQAFIEAIERARRALTSCLAAGQEPPSAALSIAVAAVRGAHRAGPSLVTLLRQLVVRLPAGDEGSLRCLRALARAGHEVDVRRFCEAVAQGGRAGRVALAGLAEQASRGVGEALSRLATELDGALKADAAFWLSHLCSESALDALAPHLRAPGPVGLHAASALLAAEEDPFAFDCLLRRLCRPAETLAAARALWGADASGVRLVEAENALGRWSRRGLPGATVGQRTASVLLGAHGVGFDLAAPLRAVAGDDELAAWAVRALWLMGDGERARSCTEVLLRRAPLVSAHAFSSLCLWADQQDEQALKVVRRTVMQRPVELSRAAMFEALASGRRPSLHRPVVAALSGHDQPLSLEAGRAVAKLHEPPSLVPDLWL